MKHGARRDPSHRLEIMSGFMSGEVARSLELLRVIDGTVEALVYTRRNMEALSETCDSLIQRAATESAMVEDDGWFEDVHLIDVELENLGRTVEEKGAATL